MVDPAQAVPSAVLLRLDGDDYRPEAESADGALVFERPFPATLNLGP